MPFFHHVYIITYGNLKWHNLYSQFVTSTLHNPQTEVEHSLIDSFIISEKISHSQLIFINVHKLKHCNIILSYIEKYDVYSWVGWSMCDKVAIAQYNSLGTLGRTQDLSPSRLMAWQGVAHALSWTHITWICVALIYTSLKI